MIFRFIGPLKHLAGSEQLEVPLRAPAQLQGLLGSLATRLDRLIPYGAKTTEAQLMANLSFFKDNRMLRLIDRIEDSDTIVVILPPTGG